ncbi:MAG: penicillin-binding protein 2 [Candidatus Pacebacteria bacterium]|nr:penicillin-binding protein 2 [Candidatus Paceibacterota bacterium]
MKYSFPFRIKVLSIGILLFGLVLITRLFFVQVIHNGSYTERADQQYATPSSNIFERGTIYFSTKDAELVSAGVQVTGFKLAINPTQITDGEAIYKTLSEKVVIDREEFMSKVAKTKDPYEEVAHHLSEEEANAISAMKIPGVSIFKEKWRFYPGNNLAAHVLGFLGYKGDELAGRYGVEREYESVLSRGADNPYVNFFAEVFSNIRSSLDSSDEKKGSVVTTIEPSVQDFLQKKLQEVKTKYQPNSVGGIIMNPVDGSIYAMGVNPDFNPNDFSKVKDTAIFSNPLVEGVLEFGSVVKPLVMAGAIDAGVLNANTTYTDKGSVVVEKHEIFNFDKKARGAGTTMQEVLNQSLNTGMVFVEQRLGRKNLRDYLLSYGIKDKTGIDLPNETSGLVSNLYTPREIEYANASFGQGIALTPVEMVRALASLSNGGNLVVPHVVKAIKYEKNGAKEITYPTTRAKISPETAEEITRMMVGVMDAYGDGKTKLPHYSIAAKTGTAQVANHVTGGYYDDRNTHSFVGFFPAYDPKFIVFLYAVNPVGSQYASITWTTPFLDITKFLLNYYEVPPDR